MRILLPLIITILFSTCGLGPKILTYEGDKAEIEMKGGLQFTGELIMVTDTALYVISDLGSDQSATIKPNKIYQLSYTDINQITIDGYVNKGWLPGVIVFNIIPAVLMMIAASSADAEISGTGVLILFAPPLLTLAIFSATQPDAPGHSSPFTTEQLNELKKYARYHTSLGDQQFRVILQKYGQTTPLPIRNSIPQ